MDESTEKLIGDLDFQRMSALEISGSKWSEFGFNRYRNIYFPEFDICRDRLDERFGIIIAKQVFEHIKKPYSAGVNVYDILKPNGYFLITTPFLIRVHPQPDDCTRWTKSGIKFFLEDCGFPMDSIQSYAWGNRKCIQANFIDWIPFNKRKHSLKNEENFPIVIWALAKK